MVLILWNTVIQSAAGVSMRLRTSERNQLPYPMGSIVKVVCREGSELPLGYIISGYLTLKPYNQKVWLFQIWLSRKFPIIWREPLIDWSFLYCNNVIADQKYSFRRTQTPSGKLYLVVSWIAEKNQIWDIVSTSMCAQIMGGHLHFSFYCRVIPFSNESRECSYNLLANAIFKVAFHSFLCAFVYIPMKNPTAFEGLASLQTR